MKLLCTCGDCFFDLNKQGVMIPFPFELLHFFAPSFCLINAHSSVGFSMGSKLQHFFGFVSQSVSFPKALPMLGWGERRHFFLGREVSIPSLIEKSQCTQEGEEREIRTW
jgi:hypothetical protein